MADFLIPLLALVALWVFVIWLTNRRAKRRGKRSLADLPGRQRWAFYGMIAVYSLATAVFLWGINHGHAAIGIAALIAVFALPNLVSIPIRVRRSARVAREARARREGRQRGQ